MKLLRTNTKLYVDRLQKEILGSIDFEDVDELSDSQKIDYLLAYFENEHGHEKRRYPNDQARLANWLMGLPSCISMPFTNYEILELVKRLHGVNELTEKREDAILSNYWNHLAFHILKLKQ